MLNFKFRFGGRYGNNVLQLINATHIHLNHKNSVLHIPISNKYITPKILNLHNIDLNFHYNPLDQVILDTAKPIDLTLSHIFYWPKNTIKYNTKNPTFEDIINQSDIINQIILELDDVNNILDNDLLIHIRSGDIYKAQPNSEYAQPPISFYHKVIEENNFNTIYIISDNIHNFVINVLKSTYGNKVCIIDEPNVKTAFNLIRNAKNICTSTSSFCTIATLLKPKNNIKNIYTYEYLCFKHGSWHFSFMFDYILKRSTYKFHIYKINNYPFMSKIDNQYVNIWSFTEETKSLMLKHDISDIYKIDPESYQ